MKKLVFALAAVAFSLLMFGQKGQPFWDDVQVFRKKDSLQKAEKGQILFIGSSSFTIWQDVQKAFPSRRIENRAFGGSTLEQQIAYFDLVVRPVRARQIVIYCGENDFAASDSTTVATVVGRFKTLFSMIRKSDRRVHVAFVSMKPSPARQHLLPKFEAANRAIEAFLKTKKRTAFVDVFSKMMENDQPRAELFGPDLLHMNEKGYAIWQAALEPILIKN